MAVKMIIRKQILSSSLLFALLLFIFSGISVSSAQVEVDRQWQGHANGTTVTIPPDFLKRTENGKLRISSGRNEGDGFDDTFRRKPRPYFDGEGLWVDNFERLRQKILELLDYIEFLFDAPERELTPEQLASALEELETLNNERHRLEAEHQQEVTEAISENTDLGDNWRFTHHAGYQEHHPAHPHHEPYKVPGIVQTPTRKETNTKGGHGQATSAQGSGAASSDQPVTSGQKNNRRTRGSSDGDGSGPPKKPRPDKEPEREVNPPVAKQTVEKEIEVDGETYRITSELTGNDLELICPICLGLVKTKAKRCNGCYKHFCVDEYERIEQTKCPRCRACPVKRFVNVNQGYLEHQINSLPWSCPKSCGYISDLHNIRAHIRNCRYEYECEHQDCGYTGSFSEVETHEKHCGFAPVECSHEGCQERPRRQNLEAHELTCQWRLVTIGPIQVFLWQKDLIDRHSIDMPGNIAPEDIRGEDEAGYALSLLVGKISSAGPPTIGCQGCGEEYSDELIESHARECLLVKQTCEYCGLLKKRAELRGHYQFCDRYPLQCSMPECDYTLARIESKKFNQHQDQHCRELKGIILGGKHYLPDAESIRYASVDRKSYAIRLSRELGCYSWVTGFSIPDWNLLIVVAHLNGKQCIALGRLDSESSAAQIVSNVYVKVYCRGQEIDSVITSDYSLGKLKTNDLLIMPLDLYSSVWETKTGVVLQLLLTEHGSFRNYKIRSYKERVEKILP